MLLACLFIGFKEVLRFLHGLARRSCESLQSVVDLRQLCPEASLGLLPDLQSENLVLNSVFSCDYVDCFSCAFSCPRVATLVEKNLCLVSDPLATSAPAKSYIFLGLLIVTVFPPPGALSV